MKKRSGTRALVEFLDSYFEEGVEEIRIRRGVAYVVRGGRLERLNLPPKSSVDTIK